MQLNLRVLSCSNIPRPEELVPIDPYVTFNLTFSKISQQTRVIDNSFDPVWKQDFKIPVDPNQVSFGIDISLRSRDAFNEDFEIGSVTGIVEDLKPYEVRNESFKINIIDIDKEKREADSSSRPISPFHLFTPRFLPNANNSNTDQTKDSADNDKPKNDQNGTYLSFMFQIAPKFHPPFEKEGAPPIPYEPPKYLNSGFRKGNSSYFLQSSIGPPYLPRGVYDKYPGLNRGDRPNSTFSFRSSHDILSNRRQATKAHDPTAAGNYRHSIRMRNNDDEIDLSGPPYLFGAPVPFPQRQRSRRRINDDISNSPSNLNDGKSYRAATRLGNAGAIGNGANYNSFIPATSSSPPSRMQRSGMDYSDYSDMPSYFGNSYSPSNSKQQASSNISMQIPPPRSFDTTKYMRAQNSPPSTSSAISNISQNGKNYAQAVPKAFEIFDRTNKSQGFNDFVPSAPNTNSHLIGPKEMQRDSSSARSQESNLREFHDIFIKNNLKKKRGEKRFLIASENPTATSKAQIGQTNIQLNKPTKTINSNKAMQSGNNNSPPYNFSNLLNNDDDDHNELHLKNDPQFDFNPYLYSDDSDEEDDEDNNAYRFNMYKLNGSSNDTLSDDDDDDDSNDYYSDIESDDNNIKLYRSAKNDNIRKQSSLSSTSPSTNKYFYQPYTNKYMDDANQSDSDDVVEILSPNFDEDKPKAPKKINYQSLQKKPAAAPPSPLPPPQIKLSTNSVDQYKPKANIPYFDEKANLEDDSNNAGKKGKKDIRFFFSSPDDNSKQAGNIKFVYKNDKLQQTENNKNSETSQSNGNSAENTGPLIYHYHAQKRGNSKKQKKRDDSPNNNT